LGARRSAVSFWYRLDFVARALAAAQDCEFTGGVAGLIDSHPTWLILLEADLQAGQHRALQNRLHEACYFKFLE
jgi:hypothetical protein